MKENFSATGKFSYEHGRYDADVRTIMVTMHICLKVTVFTSKSRYIFTILTEAQFMVSGKTKRIVVIKDIQSNIIEEAILILKNDIDVEKNEKQVKHKEASSNAESGNDYLLNEARLIIDNYIKECKSQAEARNGFNKKSSFFKDTFSCCIIAAIFCD